MLSIQVLNDMTDIYLAYKAYDIHELLCHAIADTAGLYREAGLNVCLRDSTFIPDEALPENTFHAACGAALASFLSGHPRKVVYVACDRPMFWLYGRRDIESIGQLDQGRLATYPDNTPPGKILSGLIENWGIAPGLLPSRDDVSRLGLLASGSVDGALISSYFLPHEVEARGGNQLVLVGDSIRLPSAGLAVAGELYEEKPELVAVMVGIYQQAMKIIFKDEQSILRTTLREAFGKTDEGMDKSIEVIRHCYNPFGYSYDSVLQPAVDSMAAAMGLASRSSKDLYEFKYIKSYN